MYALSSTALRRYALRPVAVALVAFCLLAAGRAFVPGMCATQRALPSLEAITLSEGCQLTARSACCMPVATPMTDRNPAPVGDAYCAFCYLAKAVAENPAPVVFPALSESLKGAPDPLSSIVRSRELDYLLTGRAPPRHV